MGTLNLSQLSDSRLIQELKLSVFAERKQTTQILEYLSEIDRRRLYADSGYPSLWDFCTQELGYTEGSACRRIASMRLIKDHPELKEKILSGEQSLSSLFQARRFFRAEEKHRKTVMTSEEKQVVLKKIEGKSARACERELIRLSSVPLALSMPERQRLIDESHTELRLVLDSSLLHKLNRIQALKAHAIPSMSYIELLNFMADEVLKKIDPTKKVEVRDPNIIAKRGNSLLSKKMKVKGADSPPAPAVAQKPQVQRKIPVRIPLSAQVRRYIWLRDGGKCTYENRLTGKSCGSRHFLEIDHVRPVALGGSNDPKNLRLFCRAHNQRAAVRIFGHKILENVNQ